MTEKKWDEEIDKSILVLSRNEGKLAQRIWRLFKKDRKHQRDLIMKRLPDGAWIANIFMPYRVYKPIYHSPEKTIVYCEMTQEEKGRIAKRISDLIKQKLEGK